MHVAALQGYVDLVELPSTVVKSLLARYLQRRSIRIGRLVAVVERAKIRHGCQGGLKEIVIFLMGRSMRGIAKGKCRGVRSGGRQY